MGFIRIAKQLHTVSPGLRRALILLFLYLAFGTASYMALESWSPVDSLYFSVISLTTIGYGDMYPGSDISKLFTVGYVLVGVGLALYIVTAFAAHLFDEEKQEIRRLERHVKHLESLLEDSVR